MATGRWASSEAGSDPTPVGRINGLAVIADDGTADLPATARWHHVNADAFAGSTAYGRCHAVEAESASVPGTASGIFELRGGTWAPVPLWQLRGGSWQ